MNYNLLVKKDLKSLLLLPDQYDAKWMSDDYEILSNRTTSTNNITNLSFIYALVKPSDVKSYHILANQIARKPVYICCYMIN